MFLYLMDCVENYELWRKWTERETEEVTSLSEWFKLSVRSLIQIPISKPKDPDVAETLSTIHDKYVVVPADKAPNNIVLIGN